MMIFLQPQADNEPVVFEYGVDTITATRNGVTDTFDFSGFRHGDIIDDIETDITTELEYNPIIQVARDEGGMLYVILLNSYSDTDKTEEELEAIVNPVWQEV